ncbi:hypothetical protein ALT717_30092 [Alteromonas macleodii]
MDIRRTLLNNGLNKFKTKSEPQKRKKASILLAFFRKNLNLIS